MSVNKLRNDVNYLNNALELENKKIMTLGNDNLKPINSVSTSMQDMQYDMSNSNKNKSSSCNLSSTSKYKLLEVNILNAKTLDAHLENLKMWDIQHKI